MEEQPATLGIRITVGPGADAEDVAVATLRLRRELLDLDVEAVELVPALLSPYGDVVAYGRAGLGASAPSGDLVIQARRSATWRR